MAKRIIDFVGVAPEPIELFAIRTHLHGILAHDIAVDLWESGAEVTMVQRSPTTVIRSETLMELAFDPLYSEAALQNGITTEKADLMFASLPFRLMAERQRPLYEEIARRNGDFYARLAKAGFLLDFGVDGSGCFGSGTSLAQQSSRACSRSAANADRAPTAILDAAR